MLLLLRISVEWKEWGDLTAYNIIFQHTSTHDFSFYCKNGWKVPDVKSEWGWTFFTWLNSCVSTNYYFFLMTSGFLILVGYFTTIYRYVPSSYLWLSLLLYVLGPYLQSFYVLRQHMAMGLMLLSYPYIINRNFLKFLSVTIICFIIHQTVLFVLPLYFFYGINNKKVFVISLLIYAGVLLSVVLYIGNATDLFIDGYNTYLRANEDEFSNFKSAALIAGVLFVRIMILRKKLFNSGITRLLSIIIIIGCLNAFIGVGRVSFMSRLNMYYSELFFLILPNTISYINIKFYRVLCAVSFLLFMGFFFFTRYNTYLTGRFIWE